jgi:hypothetical protein
LEQLLQRADEPGVSVFLSVATAAELPDSLRSPGNLLATLPQASADGRTTQAGNQGEGTDATPPVLASQETDETSALLLIQQGDHAVDGSMFGRSLALGVLHTSQTGTGMNRPA